MNSTANSPPSSSSLIGAIRPQRTRSALSSPREDPYTAVSELRSTVATPNLPQQAMNAWPGAGLSVSTVLHASALGLLPPTAATLNAAAPRCVECTPVADCDDPGCADAIMDGCTDECVTEDCTDQCMVVACMDPTHEQSPCHSSRRPCEEEDRCSTPRLVDRFMGCWGPEAHVFFNNFRPPPDKDAIESVMSPCFEHPSWLQTGSSTLGSGTHAHPIAKTHPINIHAHFQQTYPSHNPPSSPASNPLLPPTPPETSSGNSSQTFHRLGPNAFAGPSSSHIPPAPAAEPQFECRWAECTLTFPSFLELVGHVNVNHFQEMSTATVRTRPTLAPQPTLPNPAPMPTLTGNAQALADLSCHWEGCQVFQPSEVLSGPAPHAALGILATHLLQDHLGLETSRFLPPSFLHSSRGTAEQAHVHDQNLLNQQAPPQALHQAHAQHILHQPQPQHAHVQAFPSPTSAAAPSPTQPPAVLDLASPPASPGEELARPSPDGETSCACRWEGCAETFASIAELTVHIDAAHVGAGRAHYDCFWADCPRHGEQGFASKQKIKRHLQSHTGHRPFRCEMCSQNFSEAATLQQHMRRHTQQKPYLCDFPGCGKAFTVAGALTIHKRTHNGHKPFKCTFCDKAFAESSNLSKHLRTHTGARPYACGECDKAFARPDQLSRHMSVHRKKTSVGVDAGEEVAMESG